MLNIFEFWLNAFYFYRVDYKQFLLIIIGTVTYNQMWMGNSPICGFSVWLEINRSSLESAQF